MLQSAPHSPILAGLKRINPQEAYEIVQKGEAVFIDIRSEMEHFFVGHPANVINIPWQDAPDFEENPDFVKEVGHVAKKDQSIILICRSGHRTIDAGNKLLEAGFSDVASIDEGFEGDRDESYHRSSVNGWRFRGLPWVQC